MASPAIATPAAEPKPALVLRKRPVALPGAVFCSHCWEPIVHDGTTWMHVRTWTPAGWSNKDCRPLCDWPGCACEADGGRSLGGDVWTGSSFRWQAAHFLCDAHWSQYRRATFVIEHT